MVGQEIVGMKVRVGDRAPDFSLTSQLGQTLSLSDFVGKKNVVLYFYPKDFTAGCTREARTFSGSYEELKRLDAEVVGVSSDDLETHRGFSEKCQLQFPLLSDEGGRLREAYGVPSSLGLFPGRVTYVIDKQGVVKGVFSSQLQPAKHVSEAIRILRSLEEG